MSSRRWEALLAALTRRLAEKLFADLAATPSVAVRGRSPGVWLAFALAAVVHLTCLAMLVLGLWLVALRPWTNGFVVLGGVMLLLLAWICRPRRSAPPEDVLPRAQFPALYGLADRVSAALQTRPVDGIALIPDFNAYYAVAGLRSRRYVALGLPLLAVTTPQERAALLAHELSHGANGDPMRGQFLGGAVQALVHWSDAIRPTSVGRSSDAGPGGPFASLLAIPIELSMLLVSEALTWCARGLWLLVARDSQRAEYLADRLAAMTVGHAPMRSMLEKLYTHETVDAVIRRHALTGASEPLMPKIASEVHELPAKTKDELRDRARAELWQADATHPPTTFRVRMLELSEVPAKVTVDARENLALEEELRSAASRIERELVNRHLGTIYG